LKASNWTPAPAPDVIRGSPERRTLERQGSLSSFRRKPESRVPGENRDPVFEMVPDFRRDDVWTPVFTGVTTFYENISFDLISN